MQSPDPHATSCEETRVLLHALLDEELDPRSSVDVAQHLSHCRPCSAELKGLLALRQATHGLQRIPPPDLSPRIARSLRRETWRARGSLIIGITLCVAVVLIARHRPAAREAIDPFLQAHQKALQSQQLITVTHDVAAWFRERVDYAVPAEDFSSEGLALEGGRLERIQGRSVPVLVYARGSQLLDVFLYPSPGRDTLPEQLSSGELSMWRWRHAGLEWRLVGEVEPAAARQLATLLGAP